MFYKKFLNVRCNSCGLSADIDTPKNSIFLRNCTISANCNGSYEIISKSNLRKSLYKEADYTFIKASQPKKKIDYQNLLSGVSTLTISGVLSGFYNGIEKFYLKDSLNNDFILENKTTSIRYSNIFLHLYEITNEFNKYNQYTFNRFQSQYIVGEDDSNERNLLSFSNNDNIEVYVNGNKLDQSKFVAYNNTITFTPILLDYSNSIQVYVYKNISSLIQSSNIIKLKFFGFYPNSSNNLYRQSIVWGDTYAVLKNNTNNYLMYCNNLSEITIGKTYGVYKVSAYSKDLNIEKDINVGNLEILTGDAPYSFSDKDMKSSMKLENLINNVSISHTTINAETVLIVDNTKMSDTFNSITISSKNNLSSIKNEKTSGIEDKDTRFILGIS